MRGAPGSAKTSNAHRIAKGFDGPSIVLSTDDYWLNEDGQFIYDQKRKDEAHQWNQKRFEQALSDGYSLVIVDHTNIQKSKYGRYLELARQYGFEVYQYVCEGDYGCTHGLSKKAIDNIRAGFEPDPDLEHWIED